MLKKHCILLLFMITALFISCNDSPAGTNNGYSASDIQEQVLQGKINGSDWIFRSGSAEILYGDTDPAALSIVLYDSLVSDFCELWRFSSDSRLVALTIPPEGGEYPLSSDVLDYSAKLLISYNRASTRVNMHASAGIAVVEINDTDVTVRIAARYDDGSALEGVATIPVCE